MDQAHAATIARIRELRARFAEAHRDGMDSLAVGDLDRLADALKRERAIIDEQDRLITAYRNTTR